jgi:glycosyltransferase involved in cell wall biosynthesis
MKLGYVSARFPFAHAEQFFEPEVESLTEHFDVVLVPTRATSARNAYPHLRAVPHYLGFFDATVARAAAREFVRSPARALRALGVLAVGAAAPRARIVNLLLYPKALALAHEARRVGIEHLHVNWMTSSATIVYVASRLTGIPFSITAHQHDIFFDNLTARKVRAAQFVRVISARNCRHLQDLLPAALQRKCIVVHLGVRMPDPPAVPPERHVPRILCPARMCVWKGHRYLLAALARLRDAGVPFACDLAGDGEIARDVARLIERYALGDRVTMLGNVPHGALVASLDGGDYDVVVLASTERDGEHEGIPVALMEAMAAGLPVIATRTGSIPELVDDRSGVLVPDRNPAALADALRRVLADRNLRASLGAAGRRRIADDFETGTTTAQLRDVLLASAPWRTVPSAGRERGSEVLSHGAMGRFGATPASGYGGEDHVR